MARRSARTPLGHEIGEPRFGYSITAQLQTVSLVRTRQKGLAGGRIWAKQRFKSRRLDRYLASNGEICQKWATRGVLSNSSLV
jgi:hypothetical protein